MAYQVRREKRDTNGPDGTVWVLEDGTGGRAEVWPGFGFNCYRWQAVCSGHAVELLYADPQLFHGSSPTRSGIPILFPFPTRIRDGRFRWKGKDYQLPLNDPAGKNAIHGFACRRPWRVVEEGATDEAAWVTGEFRGSIDGMDARELWPADYLIRVTYRLSVRHLRIEAVVENPDQVPLPFGLGYHPYFASTEEEPGSARYLQAPARSYWELQENLPTGDRRPVDAARDLSRLRPVHELKLDDILTDLIDTELLAPEGLCLRGVLQNNFKANVLRLFASPSFRELVAFTPPHRKAVCLEPYTCTTDAINLQQRGVNAGLLVLLPGERLSAVVELVAG
jgi:aldose 1-epimerase